MLPVKGYEGLYSVLEDGRVYSHHRERIMGYSRSNGYLRVCLWKNGVQQTFRVHRLVAEAFLPNPNNYPEVNHIDKDRANNRVENLEWCSKSHNMTHCMNFRPKLREHIQLLLSKEVTVRDIMEIMRVSEDTVLNAQKVS